MEPFTASELLLPQASEPPCCNLNNLCSSSSFSECGPVNPIIEHCLATTVSTCLFSESSVELCYLGRFYSSSGPRSSPVKSEPAAFVLEREPAWMSAGHPSTRPPRYPKTAGLPSWPRDLVYIQYEDTLRNDPLQEDCSSNGTEPSSDCGISCEDMVVHSSGWSTSLLPATFSNPLDVHSPPLHLRWFDNTAASEHSPGHSPVWLRVDTSTEVEDDDAHHMISKAVDWLGSDSNAADVVSSQACNITAEMVPPASNGLPRTLCSSSWATAPIPHLPRASKVDLFGKSLPMAVPGFVAEASRRRGRCDDVVNHSNCLDRSMQHVRRGSWSAAAHMSSLPEFQGGIDAGALVSQIGRVTAGKQAKVKGTGYVHHVHKLAGSLGAWSMRGGLKSRKAVYDDSDQNDVEDNDDCCALSRSWAPGGMDLMLSDGGSDGSCHDGDDEVDTGSSDCSSVAGDTDLAEEQDEADDETGCDLSTVMFGVAALHSSGKSPVHSSFGAVDSRGLARASDDCAASSLVNVAVSSSNSAGRAVSVVSQLSVHASPAASLVCCSQSSAPSCSVQSVSPRAGFQPVGDDSLFDKLGSGTMQGSAATPVLAKRVPSLGLLSLAFARQAQETDQQVESDFQASDSMSLEEAGAGFDGKPVRVDAVANVTIFLPHHDGTKPKPIDAELSAVPASGTEPDAPAQTMPGKEEAASATSSLGMEAAATAVPASALHASPERRPPATCHIAVVSSPPAHTCAGGCKHVFGSPRSASRQCAIARSATVASAHCGSGSCSPCRTATWVSAHSPRSPAVACPARSGKTPDAAGIAYYAVASTLSESVVSTYAYLSQQQYGRAVDHATGAVLQSALFGKAWDMLCWLGGEDEPAYEVALEADQPAEQPLAGWMTAPEPKTRPPRYPVRVVPGLGCGLNRTSTCRQLPVLGREGGGRSCFSEQDPNAWLDLSMDSDDDDDDDDCVPDLMRATSWLSSCVTETLDEDEDDEDDGIPDLLRSTEWLSKGLGGRASGSLDR